MEAIWKRTWAEIDLDKLAHNFNVIKKYTKNDTKICCVVKADAYGHDAPHIARTLEALGADFFAVSNIEEAIQLRSSGIVSPILILGYTHASATALLKKYDLSQCVYSYKYAKSLSQNATELDGSIKIHIKIDTGMGRLGFKYADDGLCDDIERTCRLRGLEAEGIFTHFSKSNVRESDCDYTVSQYEKFIDVINRLEERQITFSCKHCCNSAAIFNFPEFQMDMVRAGIVLYGLSPFTDSNGIDLQPVMSLKTVISSISTVQKGDAISYGGDFVADREMRVATVPLGYADGFWRSNSTNGCYLYVNGIKTPIIGRICMDQLMLDVSNIENIKIGDEITVFGDDASLNTADSFALLNGTINYEIVCAVGKRVPRVFIKDGKVCDVQYVLLDMNTTLK